MRGEGHNVRVRGEGFVAPEEGDDPLGAVAVHVRQVDLVAEHDEPDAELHRREHHPVRRLPGMMR